MKSARVLAFAALVLVSLMTTIAQAPLPLPVQANQPTDHWAVRLAPGTDADALAASLGYINGGQIGTLSGWYIFRTTDATLTDGTRTLGLRGAPGVLQAEPQIALGRHPRGVESHIKDPLFASQWHINNTKAGLIGEDANVLGAWNLNPLCCDGTGVVVASVDDGVWFKNPDLAPNYLPSLSYDFLGNDANPSGGWHGTAVAGVMAAADDGAQCGVGMAYNAGISGLRMLGNATTDAIEAASLGYHINDIHVYNSSWGPYDNGSILEGPGPLALAQMNASIIEGRNGLGTIYVWANGNGLDNDDNSNADGYANLIYTIAVGATDDAGEQSWYSENGVNMLINAPSSGDTSGIVTTGYNAKSCTKNFGGTSSAAPLVAGVVALMLQANPDLTWRDVQYILMQTAEINDPTDTSWSLNGAGYLFSPKYGFGRIDATKAVQYAAMWAGVPATLAPISSGVLITNLSIPDGNGNTAGLTSTTANISSEMQLEHVEVALNFSHTYRGDLEFTLVSPSGTRSIIYAERPFDGNAIDGLWRVSSNQFWGETSVGTWTLEIRDYTSGDTGFLNNWELILHGISQAPAIVSQASEVQTLSGRDVLLEAFTVDMAGTTYQWYTVDGINETPIALANSRTLTVDAPDNQTAIYRFKATTGVTTAALDFNVIGMASKQLITNGAMLPNPARPKEALGWIRLNAAGNDKVVSLSPDYAFRMVSSTTEKTQIRQYVDIHNLNFGVGDNLTFSLLAKGTSRGQLKLTVYYSDGTNESCKAPIAVGNTAFVEVSCNVQLDDKTVVEVVPQVYNKTKLKGKRLDVTTLTLNWFTGGARAADNPTLTLPTAPDGFRDNK